MLEKMWRSAASTSHQTSPEKTQWSDKIYIIQTAASSLPTLKTRASDKFLTCFIKYFIMKNVKESIWGIATLDTIMMSKENWEWK